LLLVNLKIKQFEDLKMLYIIDSGWAQRPIRLKRIQDN